MCLAAQGYADRNRTLWLPKPELVVQKIPSTARSTRLPSKQQRKKQQSKPKKKRKNQKGEASQSYKSAAKPTSKQVWIPRSKISIHSKHRGKLVHIYARSKQSQPCKHYLVSDALLKAQDHYNGQQHIWVPKSLLESRSQQEKPKAVQPRVPIVCQEWRPKKSISSIKAMATHSRSSMQWVPKGHKVKEASTNPCSQTLSSLHV